MCLGGIKKKEKRNIKLSLKVRVDLDVSVCKNFEIRAFGFKRSSHPGSLEDLDESSAVAGACISRKVQANEEGAIEGRHDERGLREARWEGHRLSLVRRRRAGAKQRDEDRRNTCSGRVHAFQGFRESGEYDGGDVSLNIWRERDFKRTRVTALERRLNNAKSTYSPAVPSRAYSFFLFLFPSLFVSLCLSICFLPIPMPLRFPFSRSHHLCRSFFLASVGKNCFNPPVLFVPSLSPSLAFSIRFYSVTYHIIVLYFILYA